MSDLIRRALLGDRESQEECTRQGIALPCPFCGGERTVVINAPEGWVKCRDCEAEGPMKVGPVSALIAWNTRQALLGDREAQEECTRKGIVLPCPCCGGKLLIYGRCGAENKIACAACNISTWWRNGEKAALSAWNTRPAPPIGHCETCLYSDMARCTCWKSKVFGQSCRKDEYCSSWAPREETDHETD